MGKAVTNIETNNLTDIRIKNRVEALYKIIEEANKEFGIIRKKCSHSKCEVNYYCWAVGHISIKKICKICREVIGNPSEEELSYFNDTLGLLNKNK
ncbi:MAG: hypothetical protein HY840_15135 [Bacteroidetes bacterium]|nr:hypothetical protein [Bacteroidota bacterium]